MILSPREKWFAIIAGGVVIVAVIALYFAFQNGDSDQNDPEFLFPEEQTNHEEKQQDEAKEASKAIVIDIKGAVKKPGVYTMNEGDRVVDAIEKAGGFQKEADQNQLNLASLLKDEMVIYVPKKGEQYQEKPLQAAANGLSQEEDGKIRINSASVEELQKLQGIGPAKAQAIVTYREENGPFKTVEDLLEVSGIGEKTLENIKDDIVVD